MSPWQWTLWGVCVALEVALAVLAFRLGRSHRMVAWLFVAVAVANVAVRLGQVFVLDGATKPFAGLARGVYHVETALVAWWPMSCCALAWWAFCGPRQAEGPDRSEPSSSRQHAPSLSTSADAASSLGVPEDTRRDGPERMRLGSIAVKVILAAWLIFSAAMAVLFPLPRGMTAPILHIAHITCAAVAGLAVMHGRRRRRERPAVVASYLLAGQLAVGLVGPFAKGAPWEPSGWDVARVGYTTLFLLLLVQHAAWLRPRR